MARQDDLLRVLERLGRVRGADLSRLLEISPATLSRTVRAAGDAVCRIGRRRGASYALRRRIPGLPARVPLFRVDRAGRPERLGELNPLRDGSHWLEFADGTGVLYEGTPPFVADMQPQGYLGAGFSERHPALELPSRLSDWNDDHRLIALAHRGADCIGNLLLGEVSFDRFRAVRESGIEPVADDRYPDLANHALEWPAGSSAGGEHPKFAAFSAAVDAHVLVKFTTGTGDEADRRWRDLLVCEATALSVLRDTGVPTPAVRVIDEGGQRFLETIRYDREGHFGRLGVVSMAAYDAEFIGAGRDWTRTAEAMQARGAIGRDQVERIRFLDVFGRLIGNTDRHPGNLSFMAPGPVAADTRLRLAPVYDMLPMTFAPSAGRVVPARFRPGHPRAAELDAWPDALEAATAFWQRILADGRISDDFRPLAAQAHAGLRELHE